MFPCLHILTHQNVDISIYFDNLLHEKFKKILILYQYFVAFLMANQKYIFLV